VTVGVQHARVAATSRVDPLVLRRRVMLGAVTLGLIATTLFTLSYGQVLVPIDAVVAALFDADASGPAVTIIRALRLPRVLTALGGGAALALAGLLLQALFRNPLADPWSLGMTAGGQLGAALVVVAGGVAFASDAVGWLRIFAGVSLVVGAATGALLVALAMATLARRVGHVTLLVLGLMLGFLSQGLTSILLHFANRSQGRIFSGWNDGTFASVVPADLPLVLVPVLIGALLAVRDRHRLTSLLLGDTYATSLGVDVPALRRRILMAVILLAAPVTAYCGPVVFIGLIVPHLARLVLRTANLQALLVPVALLGAWLAVAADAVVHLPWRQHFLHLNAILALLGAPLVIALLARRRVGASE